jgi:hypothetical protein
VLARLPRRVHGDPYALLVGVAPNALMAALFFFYRARGEQTFAYIFAALGLMAFVAYVDAWLAIVGRISP